MYLLVLCTIATFFLTDIIGKYLWLYIISFLIIVVLSNMLESNASTLFAKVIPPDYNVGMINSGIYNIK